MGDNPFNAVWDAQPAAPHCEKPIEITVVAKRCVYIANYRVAGGKPYVSENPPSFDHRTTLGEILDALKEEDVIAAYAEKRARREYFAAYHASKATA